MKQPSTLVSYLFFVVITAVPPLALVYTGHADWLVPKFWLLFFFISGLTFLTVTSILMVAKINAEMYVQAFLAATTVKILASMIFALVFLLKIRVNKYVFAADFFYVYFLNMAFEIYGLLCNLRNQNLK
ncbi:hypothetical protein [Mucilaginibacter aquaedulcis]|uniref:hypothetical protein n=1 Tax=Mucilaginibacter aquaedulcis TaxID=1187081 RepID=UPI0025B3250B|nr:hypothetical protein [Mucilaginibacter aquaedulcis]MDN3550100.1 hypothetical protein [Mucilaginibacter aquaedulcis]